MQIIPSMNFILFLHGSHHPCDIFTYHQAAHQASSVGSCITQQSDIVSPNPTNSIYGNIHSSTYVSQKLETSAGQTFFTVCFKYMTCSDVGAAQGLCL